MARPGVIQWDWGNVGQQQQPQLPVQPIHCQKCGGLHAPNKIQPCFVQPEQYPKQLQWLQPANPLPQQNANNNNNVQIVAGGAGGGRRRRRWPIRFIFWDVETELVPIVNDNINNAQQQQQGEEERQRHRPILICADVICEQCIVQGVDVDREPMRRPPQCFCGVPWQQGSEARRRWCLPADNTLVPQNQMPADGRNPRQLAFHQFNIDGQQPQQQPEQQSPMAQFVDFLLAHGPRGVRTIALAHNGGRYDIILLLDELQLRGHQPKKMVAHGLRIYQLRLGGQNNREIVLKDSFNFFGCALSALPATFGLADVQDKPFFPYKYIREANLHIVLNGLPPLEDYEPDLMKPGKRRECLDWYGREQLRPQIWILWQQLLIYCRNDVKILRKGCLRFREIVGQYADGMEPFDASSTIAGLALANFRQSHHLPNRIHHTPEGGYQRNRRASAESMHFFYVMEKELSRQAGRPINIQTAQWSIGEYRVAEDNGIRVDGILYRPPPLRPLVLEYNGCYYHGCRLCFPNRQLELAGGHTAEILYNRTQQRAWQLAEQHGLQVKQVWACEWKQLLAGSRRLRKWNAQAARNVPGPMDLRKHALFGGRVEPFKLSHCCTPEEEICFLDIVSLYPTSMKYCSFPIGQAQVLTHEQLGAPRCPPLPWTQQQQNPFKGFLLCRVLPPRGTVHPEDEDNNNNSWFLPLLPMRTQKGRLVFAQCARCAERQQQQPCAHEDEERSWIAAYTHLELNKALSIGYSVIDLFEVWHYEEWSTPGSALLAGANGLFSGYVDTWLRLKAEASDWPAGCVTPEQRQAYLQEWYDREGIRLDPANIAYNAVLRHIAKMMLNSLYGKLAQRPEGEDIRYTLSAREFHDLLADARSELVDFTHLNENMDRVQTRKKPQFAKARRTNALQIACFVTSNSRVILYDKLCTIRGNGGTLLYCDTDSVAHARQRARDPCIEEGDWLGQLKRELPQRDISEFWCGGPKNYMVVHTALDGQDRREDMKIRGVELTHEAQQQITYRRFRRLIERHFGNAGGRRRHISVPQCQFHRNRRAEIHTRRSQKIYKPVYSKGVVLPGYHTRPFGWRCTQQPAAADADSDSEEEEGGLMDVDNGQDEEFSDMEEMDGI